MKHRLGTFVGEEIRTLSLFGKFAATIDKDVRADEQWLEAYLVFREEHRKEVLKDSAS